MRWSEIFNSTEMPSYEDIEKYIAEGSQTWLDIREHIEKVYQAKPKMTYSKCSAQPGWNIKYQKKGKSLCTLYPMEGYFIALIVVGAKEEPEVEMTLETFSPFVQRLYRNTTFTCGGHWLMIEVKDKAVADDLKRLIAIRAKYKY